ncbi:fasciclin domain-containing protein [Arthrobacter pityocampae]|uniref:fasciclin domain-containing protein n=1 Tax=Arthrobacter pityocampae TaxID=547334 RepID=UPI00373650AC
MQITKRRNLSIMGIAAVSMFGLAACGGGSDAASEATPSSMAEETSMASESPSMEASMSPSADAMMDPAANLVGPGCEGYAEQVPEGDGSVEGMSLLPVSDAAAANPILKQLTAAVSGGINPDVDLVDTLNGGEFTVFAPVDDAFAALPAETVEGLKTDTEGLNSILTYHVVPGKIQPSELEGTTQTTVQGADLEVTGSGNDLMVNDAKVICGGVQTANAVVYLVDTVLTPPAG